jgi:hypothetical protein
MTHNVFHLDDTYRLQTCGTSTGMSCACARANPSEHTNLEFDLGTTMSSSYLSII